MNSELKSENIVISAPLSFSGSAARIWKISRTDSMPLKWLVLIPIALLLIMCAWMFVVIWYFVLYVLFGIFFIPFRLWRRGARKNKRDKLRHRELLDAIRDNKTVK